MLWEDLGKRLGYGKVKLITFQPLNGIETLTYTRYFSHDIKENKCNLKEIWKAHDYHNQSPCAIKREGNIRMREGAYRAIIMLIFVFKNLFNVSNASCVFISRQSRHNKHSIPRP